MATVAALKPVLLIIATACIGLGISLRLYDETDRYGVTGRTSFVIGFVGLFSATMLPSVKYAWVGALTGLVVGIVLNTSPLIQLHRYMEAVKEWFFHWKGPGPRDDAPPL